MHLRCIFRSVRRNTHRDSAVSDFQSGGLLQSQARPHRCKRQPVTDAAHLNEEAQIQQRAEQQPPAQPTMHDQNTTTGIVVGVLLAVFLIGVLYFLWCYRSSIRIRQRRRRRNSGGSSRRGSGSSSGGSRIGGGNKRSHTSSGGGRTGTGTGMAERDDSNTSSSSSSSSGASGDGGGSAETTREDVTGAAAAAAADDGGGGVNADGGA